MVRTLCKCFVGLAIITIPSFLAAQVQLPTVNLGTTSFEDGVSGPGSVVEEYSQYNHAGQFNDEYGNKVQGNNTLDSAAIITHYAHCTTHRILGAYYGAEALAQFADLSVNTAAGGSAHIHGMGDMIVAPVMLVWNNRTVLGRPFSSHMHLSFEVPTGKYSDTRVVNLGANIVSFNPWYAFTVYSKDKKFEFSSRIHYLWNSKNDDPYLGFHLKSVQPGQALHANYAASYEIRKGVRLGFNAYALEQIADHKINGPSVAGSRERAFGFGPGVKFTISPTTFFWVNGYVESGVGNRPKSTMIQFRIAKLFGAPRPANHE